MKSPRKSSSSSSNTSANSSSATAAAPAAPQPAAPTSTMVTTSGTGADAMPRPGVKSRVFLVDDHPVTRQGVAALINSEPDLEVVGEADSAPQALDMIQKLKPELAVVDISLKSTSGIELVKNVRAVAPEVSMLIMSMHDEGLYAERALRAGARGYIMKQEASDKIIVAIRRVLQGKLYLSARMKEKMLHRLVETPKEETAFPIDSLSDREMEVFELIGNGFTTRQIAERLKLSVKTIDSYREHLKLKLRIDKGSDLVRYAIQWTKTANLGV